MLVINAATYAVTATIPVCGVPYGVAVTPNGSKVYVTDYNDSTVTVINAVTNKVIATMQVGPWLGGEVPGPANLVSGIRLRRSRSCSTRILRAACTLSPRSGGAALRGRPAAEAIFARAAPGAINSALPPQKLCAQEDAADRQSGWDAEAK